MVMRCRGVHAEAHKEAGLKRICSVISLDDASKLARLSILCVSRRVGWGRGDRAPGYLLRPANSSLLRVLRSLPQVQIHLRTRGRLHCTWLHCRTRVRCNLTPIPIELVQGDLRSLVSASPASIDPSTIAIAPRRGRRYRRYRRRTSRLPWNLSPAVALTPSALTLPSTSQPLEFSRSSTNAPPSSTRFSHLICLRLRDDSGTITAGLHCRPHLCRLCSAGGRKITHNALHIMIVRSNTCSTFPQLHDKIHKQHRKQYLKLSRSALSYLAQKSLHHHSPQ